MKELELKITNIDKKEELSRLNSLGARYVGTYKYKRIIAIVSKSRGQGEAWLRVRSDGKQHVLTLKHKKKRGFTVADKYDIKVKDFKTAALILRLLSKKVLYFENRRIEYRFMGEKITIDKWPYLPWSVEIEGNSKKKIFKIYKILDIKGKPVGNTGGSEGYKLYNLDYEKVGREKIRKLDRIISTS